MTDSNMPSEEAKTKASWKVGVLREFSGWTQHHAWIFLTTFFSYALYHSTRKTFSNVKSVISESWRPQTAQNLSANDIFPYEQWRSHHLFESSDDAETFLGYLDFSFLIAYAVGLYTFGVIGDRYDPRKVLSLGMVVSAILTILFGFVSEVTHLYNKAYYVVFWMTSGLIQASGWPTLLCVMGNWFGKGSRGAVVGLWSANASIGNIIGSYLVSYFLPFGYEFAFLVTGSMLFCGGVIVWMSLIPAPREMGLPEADEGLSEKVIIAERPEPISVFKAILLPGVIIYTMAYAAIKFVNYSFFYWIPFYLNKKYSVAQSTADQLSTWYDWGGIIGGFVGGTLTDLIGCRAPVPLLMLVAAIFTLFGYQGQKLPINDQVNAALLGLAGFLIGGPANLISGAVCADLGRNTRLLNNAEAVSTVAGIMDGTASVSAAVGQLLVPFMDIKAGWLSVFIMFMVLCFIAALCLVLPSYRDIKELLARTRARPSTTSSEENLMPNEPDSSVYHIEPTV